jgi:hypothetical protein
MRCAAPRGCCRGTSRRHRGREGGKPAEREAGRLEAPTAAGRGRGRDGVGCVADHGGSDPEAEGWAPDEGDPPCFWARDGLYPDIAFIRSLGDLTAEAIGVFAESEVKSVEITPSHLFFVVASDGVFEFLSSQEVVDRVPASFSALCSFSCLWI